MATKKSITKTDKFVPFEGKTKATGYAIVDTDIPIIYGVYTDPIKAESEAEAIINLIVEKVFAVDPKESGLNRETDYEEQKQQISSIIEIQRVPLIFS